MTILPKKKPPPKEKKTDSSESETEEVKVPSHPPHPPNVTASNVAPPPFIEERQPFSSHCFPPEEDYYDDMSYEAEETASPPQRKQYGSPVHAAKQREWDSPDMSGYNSSEEYEPSRRIVYDTEVCVEGAVIVDIIVNIVELLLLLLTLLLTLSFCC